MESDQILVEEDPDEAGGFVPSDEKPEELSDVVNRIAPKDEKPDH